MPTFVVRYLSERTHRLPRQGHDDTLARQGRRDSRKPTQDLATKSKLDKQNRVPTPQLGSTVANESKKQSGDLKRGSVFEPWPLRMEDKENVEGWSKPRQVILWFGIVNCGIYPILSSPSTCSIHQPPRQVVPKVTYLGSMYFFH